MGQWNVVAQTVFKVRAYNFQADTGADIACRDPVACCTDRGRDLLLLP